MRAQFVRGIDPKDAMSIGDPEARLAQSLKDLCDEMGYEFRVNKKGTPRMVVPVNYTIDTEKNSANDTRKFWKNGVVKEIHYTLTYMAHRQDDGPISLRKVWCGYDGDAIVAGDYQSKGNFSRGLDPKEAMHTGKYALPPFNDIKQSLLGRFHSFSDVIAPIKKNIMKEWVK